MDTVHDLVILMFKFVGLTIKKKGLEVFLSTNFARLKKAKPKWDRGVLFVSHLDYLIFFGIR